MKVLMKPINMIAVFEKGGILNPIKFRIEGKDESIVTVNVDKVVNYVEEKIAGNRMITYICQSVIKGAERVYELRYDIGKLKWFLYKM